MNHTGRVIKQGHAEGTALVSRDPISFLGGVDPDTGIVIAHDSDIRGQSVQGRILVFPHGKGSTVGSYILLRLKKNGTAPLGIINESSEPIVSVGAIIADIPMVDNIGIGTLATGDHITIDGETVTVRKKEKEQST